MRLQQMTDRYDSLAHENKELVERVSPKIFILTHRYLFQYKYQSFPQNIQIDPIPYTPNHDNSQDRRKGGIGVKIEKPYGILRKGIFFNHLNPVNNLHRSYFPCSKDINYNQSSLSHTLCVIFTYHYQVYCDNELQYTCCC